MARVLGIYRKRFLGLWAAKETAGRQPLRILGVSRKHGTQRMQTFRLVQMPAVKSRQKP